RTRQRARFSEASSQVDDRRRVLTQTVVDVQILVLAEHSLMCRELEIGERVGELIDLCDVPFRLVQHTEVAVAARDLEIDRQQQRLSARTQREVIGGEATPSCLACTRASTAGGCVA